MPSVLEAGTVSVLRLLWLPRIPGEPLDGLLSLSLLSLFVTREFADLMLPETAEDFNLSMFVWPPVLGPVTGLVLVPIMPLVVFVMPGESVAGPSVCEKETVGEKEQKTMSVSSSSSLL